MLLRRSPRRWPWLLLVPVLAVLALFQAQLTIDVHNSALKAPGTEEAHQQQRLASTFGAENAIALAFTTRSHDEVNSNELDGVDLVADRIRREGGVRSVTLAPANERDAAVLIVETTPIADAPALAQIAATMTPPTLRMIAAGLPLAEAAIASGVVSDRERLVPLIGLALFGMLWLLFRSLAQAVAGLLPALSAIFTVGSLQCALGQQLDPIAVLLEPVLLTIGVATAAHSIATFRRLRARADVARSLRRRLRAEVTRPTLLATATTMLAFLALSLHPIPAVAAFGTMAALGTAIVHALALELVPRWLEAFPGRPAAVAEAIAMPAVGERSRCYIAWLQRRAGGLLLATGVAAALGAYGWATLCVDNDPLAVLPTNDAVTRDFAEFSGRFGGVESFALLVDGGSPAASPDRLQPFVADCATTLPANGLLAAPRLGHDGTVMVPIRLCQSGSASRCRLFERIERRARQLGLAGIHLAGLPVQIARDSERLVRGQLLGMGLTTVGLFAALLIGLRSLRLAVVGLVPNVLPCGLLYGGMAWFDVPLTVGNAMIGTVMLGLIVDNTIHLLLRFQRARGVCTDRVAQALAVVARPMLISSLVLATGLGLGCAGAMHATREFAVLSATTIALALVGDGVVLPVLLTTRFARRAIA